MRLIGSLVVLAAVIVSCATSTSKNGLFDNLADKETVVIYLSRYNLDSVPQEIVKLKAAERLSIDSGGWTIYPPLSALGDSHLPFKTDEPPFKSLPSEIAELTNLRVLSLVGLNLKQLPKNFDELENLDSLSLEMNKLDISNEIGKLNKLKNLKYLRLFGNQVDSVDIQELKRVNPNLRIDVDVWDLIESSDMN